MEKEEGGNVWVGYNRESDFLSFEHILNAQLSVDEYRDGIPHDVTFQPGKQDRDVIAVCVKLVLSFW